MLTIDNLTCEYRTNPLGIDVTAPRLSWKLVGDQAGLRQAAYRILAASTPALLAEGKADLWDSGRVESDASVLVPYGGPKPIFAPAGLLAGHRVGRVRRQRHLRGGLV